MNKIMVLGSTNVDYMMKMEKFPVAGETLDALEFKQSMGGKGANQALSAHRLGGDVLFITSLGNDVNGSNTLSYFKDEGLNVLPLIVENVPSGSAMIWVNSKGENCIVLNPGSNHEFTPDLINRPDIENAIRDSEIILLQMEIPYITVKKICKLASELNKIVILNVAPARELDSEFLKMIDYLVVNVVEAEMISGIDYDGSNKELIIDKLLDLGASTVILTLGKHGSILKSSKYNKSLSAYDVEAVDTTGAGDTFCGAFAAELSKGSKLDDALHFATAAAAICVTRMGAQPSIPSEKEVRDFMKYNILN